jgi:hypothetical protein
MPVVNEKITTLDELLRRLVPAGDVTKVELKLYLSVGCQTSPVVQLIEHVAVCDSCVGDGKECRIITVDYEVFLVARSKYLVIGVMKGRFQSSHDFEVTRTGQELVSGQSR